MSWLFLGAGAMGFWQRLVVIVWPAKRSDQGSLHAVVQQLRDALAALEAEVLALKSQAEHARLVEDRFVSKTECARRLGVSVSNTLQPAIRAGLVRTVRV